MLISSHMCGKTGQLFIASTVQELNTDGGGGGWGGSDEDICLSCMMGPGRSSMLTLRPHDVYGSVVRMEKNTFTHYGGGGGRETGRLGSLKAEKLIILPVFFDVITPN